MIEATKGSWWLDCGEGSGVWPCQVTTSNVFGVKVKPTHPAAPYYNEEVWVDHNRVYDSGFNRVTH